MVVCVHMSLQHTYVCMSLQLVGSAPQFPHGVIDSITEIAQVSMFHVYD